MSDLPLTTISIEQGLKLSGDFSISLKRDGTLIYYRAGELDSPRCRRSERYKHILLGESINQIVGESKVSYDYGDYSKREKRRGGLGTRRSVLYYTDDDKLKEFIESNISEVITHSFKIDETWET